MASPSNPSVKFTEFAEPEITNIEKGINNIPKSNNISLKIGTANLPERLASWTWIKNMVKINEIAKPRINLSELDIPLEFLLTTFV